MKPILFNTDMVRAILEGRKTVTRRVVKPQLVECPALKMYNDDIWRIEWWNVNEFHSTKVPYCIGDILYVREAFCLFDADHVNNGVKYAYKADATPESERARKDFGYKWRPSIHMPREVARIFLRVTDVRVERLQDITEEQSILEGFEAYRSDSGYYEPATLGFVETWGSTIKKADRALYGWEANPWVWVIEFERCEMLKGD